MRVRNFYSKNTMDSLHGYIRSVHIPGLADDVCYFTHVKSHLNVSRENCVTGLRALVKGFFPFLYLDEEFVKDTRQQCDKGCGTETLVVEQPGHTKKE